MDRSTADKPENAHPRPQVRVLVGLHKVMLEVSLWTPFSMLLWWGWIRSTPESIFVFDLEQLAGSERAAGLQRHDAE